MRERVAIHAMATRFECVLLGGEPGGQSGSVSGSASGSVSGSVSGHAWGSESGRVFGRESARLRSIGEAALREVRSLEARLSFYNERSELSRINRDAARGPVRVAPDVMDLLLLCRRIHRLTHGAFDPTVAGLMSAWGFTGTARRVPGLQERRRALAAVGLERVELDPEQGTVRFKTPGMSMDLGGVVKGYALDLARGVLEEHGIENALLHGGTSTVLALGSDEDGRVWNVGLADPWASTENAWFRRTDVHNECLSVSAVSGKSFIEDGIEYGHVMDPRSGEAVSGRLVSACVTDSAAEADALSTAMLVLGPDELRDSPPGNPLANLSRCARFSRGENGWSLAAGRFDN